MKNVDAFYSFDTSLLYFPYKKAVGTLDEYEADEFRELYIHELAHWYQHHGTSFGNFVSSLKAALNAHILDILGSLPPAGLSSLLKNRRSGIPYYGDIIENEDSIQEMFGTPRNFLCRGTGFEAASTFYCLFVADAIFRRYSRVTRHPSAGHITVVALLYLDKHLSSIFPGHAACTTDRLGFDAAVSSITNDFSPLYLEDQHYRMPIDTEDLLESCALLIEITFLLYAWRGPRGFPISGRRFKTAFGTDFMGGSASFGRLHGLPDEYQGAIRYAAFILAQPYIAGFDPTGDTSWDFFSENTPTMLACLQAALNPPLPPNAKLRLEALEWQNIYPPLRYGRCLMAVHSIGKLHLSKETTRTDVDDYVRRLTAHAGLAYCPPSIDPAAKSHLDEYVETARRLANDRRRVIEEMREAYDFNDFTYACRLAFARLNSEHQCGTIIDLMLSIYRGQTPEITLTISLEDERLTKYLSPPVVIDTSNDYDNTTSQLWPQGFAPWLTFKGAVDYALLDLLISTGKPDFEGRLRSDALDHIHRCISASFDESPW